MNEKIDNWKVNGKETKWNETRRKKILWSSPNTHTHAHKERKIEMNWIELIEQQQQKKTEKRRKTIKSIAAALLFFYFILFAIFIAFSL